MSSERKEKAFWIGGLPEKNNRFDKWYVPQTAELSIDSSSGGCVISHIQYALKGQKHLAQGIALGFRTSTKSRPERAKAFKIKAFALSGRLCFCQHYPGRCPGLGAFGLSARPRLPLSRLMTHPPDTSAINVKNIKSNKILKEKHGVILGNVYFCIYKNLGNV